MAVRGRYAGVMERTTRAVAQIPAVPEDLDATDAEEGHRPGRASTPRTVEWPVARYDLGDRRDRARVYEQVLREGNDDDVRRFIRVDDLIELWDELVLPRHVRRVWADWLERHRGVSVPC
jgi:hypothetical protein